MSEINVTPMVDVMLVPYCFYGHCASFDRRCSGRFAKNSCKSDGGKDEPLVVTINKNGDIFFRTQTDLDQLAPAFGDISESAGRSNFVRGDQTIPYGMIMSVIGKLNDPALKGCFDY